MEGSLQGYEQVINLEEEKIKVTRDRDRMRTTVADLKSELARWADKVRLMEKDKMIAEESLVDVKSNLQSKKVECDRSVQFLPQ
jgi:hypothetical protein